MDPTLDWRDIGFRGGQVTRAFDDWRLEEGYLRAYLRLGLQFAEQGYESQWHEALHQPSDGEGPDLFDVMDEAVGGLTPQQYEQLHLSSVLRDGVTIFEMYAEKAFTEVVAWQLNRGIDLPERSPNWSDLKDAWWALARLKIATSVEDVRRRRHWLTHQRGELRTDNQRQRYDTREYGLPDEALRLTAESVGKDLDILVDAVLQVDAVAHRLSWGRQPVDRALVGSAITKARWDGELLR